MRRRHDRGESVDDGKVAFLEGLFQKCRVWLGTIWDCVIELGTGMGVWVWERVLGRTRGWVGVVEEVGAFLRDMDWAGVGFGGEEWEGEVRRWVDFSYSLSCFLSFSHSFFFGKRFSEIGLGV